MLAVLLILCFVLIAVYYQWSRRKTLAAVAHMDGPPALPLIGNLYLLLKHSSEASLFNYIFTIGRIYNYPVRMHMGPIVHVLLADPDHIQTVLNSPHCLSKSRQYEFFGTSVGIVTAPSHLWKRLRKNLNNSFGNPVVNSFAGIFNEKSSIFVQNLARYIDYGETDISYDIVKCFLDMIYATAFGINLDLQRTSLGDEVAKIEEEYVELSSKRMMSPLQYPEFMYRLTKDHKKHKEKLEFYRDSSRKVLKTKLQIETKLYENFLNRFEEHIMIEKKPKIVLESLLDLARKSENFTMEDIIDNMTTIIVAGNDTTATTLKMILLMLAIHPDIQERLHEEILQACPGKNQMVSVEDVSVLPLTEMVCKETLRLYPIGPMLGRVTTQDIKLDDKYTIPVNSEVIINYHYLHRNPSIWGPEADKFDPDRFLPENSIKRHPYAYLPFAAGPRNCLGMRYAWLSMKIFIVHVLRAYRLKTSLTMDDIKVKPSVIMRVLNKCLITLEERC